MCKIWYSISQTVSDLGNIHDRSITRFRRQAPRLRRAAKRLRGLTAQHGRANCWPCRDARPTIECTLLRTMSDRWSAGSLKLCQTQGKERFCVLRHMRVGPTRANVVFNNGQRGRHEHHEFSHCVGGDGAKHAAPRLAADRGWRRLACQRCLDCLSGVLGFKGLRLMGREPISSGSLGLLPLRSPQER